MLRTGFFGRLARRALGTINSLVRSTMNDTPTDDSRSDSDRKADAWAVMIIFWALVAGAVHYVSGWTFDF